MRGGSTVRGRTASIPPAIRRRFLAAGTWSLVAWTLLSWLSPGPALEWTPEMREASRTMEAAIGVVARHCLEYGVAVSPAADPNRTCLIGPETGGLFTTLGQLEAKRTTTAPDWAGLLAHLLRAAGVEEGENVAIGASGSFPALLIAAQAAAEAIGARPVVILSLGASSYGATRADFHLLDLHELLVRTGVFRTPAAAVSLGGAGDAGEEFGAELKERLLRELRGRGVEVLSPSPLPARVAQRLRLYESGGPIAAFVNIGGSEANLGSSPSVLEVPPGLSFDLGREVGIPEPSEQGVLFAMAARGVPVLHLLHIRGLALRYGLPWDPIPLPPAGSIRLRDPDRGRNPAFWGLTLLYGAGLLAVLVSRRRSVT